MMRWRQIQAAARQLLRERYRDARLPGLALVLLLLSAAAVSISIPNIKAREAHRLQAQATERSTWLAQGPRNPHTAAHFARLALKPVPPTAVLDTGPSAYMGSAVWLEAHWQRPANFREAEDYVDLGRLSGLTFAWVWQVLAPLCAIVLGFDALARERASGTWAFLAGNGVDLHALIFGKALGLALFLMAGLTVGFLFALAGEAWIGGGLSGDQVWRNGLWLILHGVYLTALAGLVVVVSARARTPESALITLMAVWIGWIVVLPPLVANTASWVSPMPSADQFWLRISHDIAAGLDARQSAAARASALKDQTLARYGVSSISQLPVSYAAVSLQAEEQYGNRVFDRRFGELEQAERHQRQWLLAVGLVNPLTAVQALSAALAGTDEAHHLDFTRQAEAQRRVLIGRLNADMIEHGAGQDFQYRAPAAFWATLPEIHYKEPGLQFGGEVIGCGGLMLAWLGLMGFMLQREPLLAAEFR